MKMDSTPRARAAHLKLLWVLSIRSLRLCRGLVIQELRKGFRILEHC